jgi:S1-C subfamily serine protease
MAILAASFAARSARRLAAGAFILLASGVAARAETRSLDELLAAVVRVKTVIEPDARTADSLGREREGSGVVIDGDGLVLTIGYLMVEARTAEIGTHDGRTVPAAVVGYDHETGFGLLRGLLPLKVAPIAFGRSADVKEADPVLVASAGGAAMVLPARVVAKREFAGSWEYLVGEALFTAPPHPAWSGAALINRDGRLVGIGSLIVGDAAAGTPGNMFVPTDGLHPILGDLLAAGRVSGPGRPWLGVAANEVRGELVVARVTPGGPAEQAGVHAGDTIVGVNGETVATLAAFYRKLWAQGGAGAVVTLELSRNDETRRVEVRSMNRLDHLRLKSRL